MRALFLSLVLGCGSGFTGDRPGEWFFFGDCPDGSSSWTRHIGIWSFRVEGWKVLVPTAEICGDVVAEPRGDLAVLEPKGCGPASGLRLLGGMAALVANGSQTPSMTITAHLAQSIAVVGLPDQSCQFNLIGMMGP